MKELFRAIPGCDASKQRLCALDPMIARMPKDFVRQEITAYWDCVREKIKEGRITAPEELRLEAHEQALLTHLHKRISPNFVRVINATGVVVHTNMGRSVLCDAAIAAVTKAASGYSNLELDLATGERGSRYSLIEDILCQLTGAEAAMVVNNNAAAVLLMLDTVCRDFDVLVSRGELVEIGGSFRIPEVMARSGAHLCEVGATNRTHLRDYADAIGQETKALLRVHTSNFRIIGFHSQVPLADLAALAHAHGLLLLEDLGSGSLVHFGSKDLPDEPTVQESVAAGADLVTFSGDKVLGGPQAGIVVGKRELIEAMKRNQLARALRCDKLCLAALEATLSMYRDPLCAKACVPTLRAILRDPHDLLRDATQLAKALAVYNQSLAIAIKPSISRVGGGAFPQHDVPTSVVTLKPLRGSVLALKMALLQTDPPLLGRLDDQHFCLDPRTILPGEEATVVRVVGQALQALGALHTESDEGRFV